MGRTGPDNADAKTNKLLNPKDVEGWYRAEYKMEPVLEIKEVSLEEDIGPGPEKISTGRETREGVSVGRDQVGQHTKLESTWSL